MATGCCLLFAGTIADNIGSRIISIGGCVIAAIFIAASGGAQTTTQFIIFRAFQGIGAAMFSPAAISIPTAVVPRGKARNLGFNFLGLSQSVGLQAGLILVGVFDKKNIPWRIGLYMCCSNGNLRTRCMVERSTGSNTSQCHQDGHSTQYRLGGNLSFKRQSSAALLCICVRMFSHI